MSCSLIRGVGEVDLRAQDEQHENDVDQLSARSTQSIVVAPDAEALPYLLLDIRTPDDYEKCHIIGGMIMQLFKLRFFNSLALEEPWCVICHIIGGMICFNFCLFVHFFSVKLS